MWSIFGFGNMLVFTDIISFLSRRTKICCRCDSVNCFCVADNEQSKTEMTASVQENKSKHTRLKMNDYAYQPLQTRMQKKKRTKMDSKATQKYII